MYRLTVPESLSENPGTQDQVMLGRIWDTHASVQGFILLWASGAGTLTTSVM